MEITEAFLGSQLDRTGGASAVTGGERGVTYVRKLLGTFELYVKMKTNLYYKCLFSS